MFSQFHNSRFYLVLTSDILIFIMALFGAYLLRFDFSIEPFYREQIRELLPILLPIKLIVFFVCGQYRGMWRFTSLNELYKLAKVSFLAMLLYIAMTLYILGFQGFPRSIFILDCFLTFLMGGALRVGIRHFYMLTSNPGSKRLNGLSDPENSMRKRKAILIIGAGAAGEKIYRVIVDNPHLNYHLVGFLDDDRGKWGRSLHGVNVYGSVEMLPKIIEDQKIDEVLIAIPSAAGAQMRRIIDICKSCEVRYRTLPEIAGIIDGKLSIKSFRDVRYEDLLRRPPVKLDAMEISQYLQGKRVLVTGAGGSIGSELCRQIIRFDPGKLILLDASEPQLFNIQMELQHELNFQRYYSLLGKVQDLSLMKDVFSEYRPQVIFHAAAYKHVPLLERNPWEAINNNVIGSRLIMNLSLKYNVERFVLVSSDKAVRPTNVMGASKRLTELIMQSLVGNSVRFIGVRFGNVIGSSGSVLPLFRRQLEQGGPITVTHPEATRFFMTIPEAAQLILQAGGLGEGGEIFILEMGTPVNIAKMAEELVRLSGKEPGRDVEIIFTGLREGEKLYEELISDGEDIVNTSHKNILVLRTNGWNGEKSQNELMKWLGESLAELYRIADTHDAYAIKSELSKILPEYMPQQEVNCVLPWKCSKAI